MPWMLESKSAKKACITLLLGTILYIITWCTLYNYKMNYMWELIFYGLVLVFIMDLALLAYSYKECRNRIESTITPKEVEEAFKEVEEVDPPVMEIDDSEKRFLHSVELLINEKAERSAARVIQNWWKSIQSNSNSNSNTKEKISTVSIQL